MAHADGRFDGATNDSDKPPIDRFRPCGSRQPVCGGLGGDRSDFGSAIDPSHDRDDRNFACNSRHLVVVAMLSERFFLASHACAQWLAGDVVFVSSNLLGLGRDVGSGRLFGRKIR